MNKRIYTTGEIAEILKATVYGNPKAAIKDIITDSRTPLISDDLLFVAINGKNHNGHNYIAELVKKSVVNFLIENTFFEKLKDIKANYIIVNNTLSALQQLAAYHRNNFAPLVVAITGSNGKTILKEWLYQTLHTSLEIVRSPKSYNSQIGVPLSVMLLHDKARLAIFEAGISQPAEMLNLQRIIQPTVGIFTNIGNAHQENFESQVQKISEKALLFSESEAVIYCEDYELIDFVFKTQHQKLKHITWSRKNANSYFFVESVVKQNASTIITSKIKGRSFSLEIPFTDDASAENAVNLWVFLNYMGYEHQFIAKQMKLLVPVAMRLEQKAAINNCTLINDTYNSDIESINIAFNFLTQQTNYTQQSLIFSDIQQSNIEEINLYNEVAQLVNRKHLKRFIGIGTIISKFENLFKAEETLFFQTTRNFLEFLPQIKFDTEAILLKGARSFAFEQIAEKLQFKTHRTTLEVNLNALIHNLNVFRSLVKAETKIMVMVKAFSYGSGLNEIANLLHYHRINYLAVAFIDEGITLRKAAITLPIMVLSPEFQFSDLMIENHLEPEIYSFDTLDIFHHSAKLHGAMNYPIHIKLDTGMHRLGFCEPDIPLLIAKLKEYDNLSIVSVFSHLATSDSDNYNYFTQFQLSKFELMSAQIIAAFDYKILRHVLNSAGIERFPQAQFDMVRLGIGLYGVSSLKSNKLLQISKLKTNIVQIKKLHRAETVGYSRNGVLTCDSVIATIPIGYADGLNRKLSNRKGKVEVNGKLADIVGNICMDLCMIDITDIEAKVGDEVIIFGGEQTIENLAQTLETIPYEILTSISQRVKRVYFYE